MIATADWLTMNHVSTGRTNIVKASSTFRLKCVLCMKVCFDLTAEIFKRLESLRCILYSMEPTLLSGSNYDVYYHINDINQTNNIFSF